MLKRSKIPPTDHSGVMEYLSGALWLMSQLHGTSQHITPFTLGDGFQILATHLVLMLFLLRPGNLRSCYLHMLKSRPDAYILINDKWTCSYMVLFKSTNSMQSATSLMHTVC